MTSKQPPPPPLVSVWTLILESNYKRILFWQFLLNQNNSNIFTKKALKTWKKLKKEWFHLEMKDVLFLLGKYADHFYHLYY